MCGYFSVAVRFQVRARAVCGAEYTIGINILDFEYIQGTDKFHTTYHISEDTEHIKYTDVLEWHIVELPKLPPMTDGSQLYNWAKFINSKSEEEMKMLATQDMYIKQAYEELEVISQDEQKRLEYTARQKALYDYNTMMEENFDNGVVWGMEKGIAEGEIRKAVAVVKKLMEQQFTLENALAVAEIDKETYEKYSD